MLKRIIKRIMQVLYKPSIYMINNKKYKDHEIGEWTYGKPEIILGRTPGKFRIGKYCSIAPNVEFILVNDHRTDFVTTYPFTVLFNEYNSLKGYPRHRGDLVVGNDVWIGFGARLLSGIRIGDGVVIAANAMVAKDVPPYAIVAGNPANIIRYRFTPDIIEKLLQIKWWDWPHKKVLNAVPLLANDDINKFITYAMQIDDKN